MTRQIRQSLLRTVSLEAWVQMRQLVCTARLYNIYTWGVETLLQMDDAWLAWSFLQRVHAIALHDIILEKGKPNGTLAHALLQSPTASEFVQTDAETIGRGDSILESQTVDSLLLSGSLREKIAQAPGLHFLFRDPDYHAPLWYELDDVWNLSE